MSEFVERAMIFVDELLQNAERVGDFMEADAEDVKALRDGLEARETVVEKLVVALQGLSNMYTHAWDSEDGSLVMMLESVPLFEARHQEAQEALALARGDRP